jgi:subtilisin family serine protease
LASANLARTVLRSGARGRKLTARDPCDRRGWPGTSFSAPHVSGAAALIRAISPSLSNVQLRRILAFSRDDLGTSGFDADYGWGRLHIGRAVFWANQARNIR